MLAKACTLALIGSAAAFSPSMSMGGSTRRQALQTAAAGAVVAPLLRGDEASARVTGGPRKPLSAPVISILDHRGCPSNANHQEYKGKKAGDDNDEMCVVVRQTLIKVSEEDAAKKRQEFINFKDNGIDVKIIANQGASQTYRPQ
jgi:hypothetical protein